MKLIIAFVFACSTAFATEVNTDCPAMNHSRDKIVKDVSVKKGKTRTQVVSQ